MIEKAKILIVEDEAVTAKELQMRLQKMGYDVPCIVATGEKAIEKALEITPDLLLMDITLRGQIDGIEAAREIRLTNDIPVIYVSAYTDKMMSERAKETEPYGFLSKPLSEHDLINTIEAALYKHGIEKSLKESHKRLLMVLDSLNAGVYVADMKTYEILFVNKYTRDLFGDVEGKICWQTLQTDQTGPCSFCTNNKLLTSDGQPSDVYCWEFKNTITDRWYYVQDKALKWVDDRTVRLEIATDITKRKRAEEEIKRKNIELNTFINSISDMAWFKDTGSNFVIVNKAFGDAVGMDPEYLVNNSCEICFGPEAAKIFKEDDQKVMKSRERVVFEESILDTNGNKVLLETIKTPLFDEAGEVLGTIGVARDITERKHAEETISKSENELSCIFNAITDFMTVVNTDYRIERVNRIVEKQYGNDLVGKVCYEVYQGRKEICPNCPTKKAIETKKPAYSFQPATEVSPPVDIYAFPILNKEGDVIAVVEHGKDITERKQAEEEMKTKISELEGFHELAVGREAKMIELKKAIKHLESELSKCENNHDQ